MNSKLISRKRFCWRSNLSNDDITVLPLPGVKTGIDFNPFAPGDFAEKRVLKLVEWFSGHCRAIKS